MNVPEEDHLEPAHHGNRRRIRHDNDRVPRMVAEQRGRERQERDEREVREVEADQSVVHPPEACEQPVVSDPVAADHREAQEERGELRGRAGERVQGLAARIGTRQGRHADAHREQRQRDGEDTVREREDARELVASPGDGRSSGTPLNGPRRGTSLTGAGPRDATERGSAADHFRPSTRPVS